MLLTRENMEDLTNFVAANQPRVEEAIESLSPDTPQATRDTLEVLQQSLYASGVLVRLYQKHPKHILKLINKL